MCGQNAKVKDAVAIGWCVGNTWVGLEERNLVKVW